MTGAMAAGKTESESVLAARRWMFGAAILDERSLTLVVNDQSVELERKPLEVLLHLLHHAGEVVTKDELLAAVWPGRVLSDSALTSCMHKLREALSDDAQDIIRTQHGYGYRLIAPVRVETSTAPAPPRFDLKPGDHPPQRLQWSLVERLGAGGHGEAWLVQHDKTRETRMFKFAADGAALTSLKREITLSRLLHDALGERSDIVRVLDWNLEEAPYFIEAGYSQEGSLVTWAKAQGGLYKVSLATRLDLVAQIADALAAAHSVGVLHKDLKPSNVLIDIVDDRPRIKLSDFGSGGVLDLLRLEQMGITRMGFTQTVSGLATASGTPLYLAPEVISGQPFTIQSDIYALGVMLYQIVTGDFSKPLAPGWEQDVPDELLRQDIAQAADGHPEQRIADVSRVAHRLRTLDERRRALEGARAAVAETEKAKLQVERMKARRVWVRLTIAASVTGVVVSLLLLFGALRARDAATEAAATSKAVSDFLNKDVFAFITAGERPLRNLEVKQLLDAAALQVDKRFAQQPEAAAEVHASLGSSYLSLEYGKESAQELDRALALFREQGLLGTGAALAAAQNLVIPKYVMGDLETAFPMLEAVLKEGERNFGTTDPGVIKLRSQIAFGRHVIGEWDKAADGWRRVLTDIAKTTDQDPRLTASIERRLGFALTGLGSFQEAEQHLRRSYSRLRSAFGDDDPDLALTRAVLADVLTEVGDYGEAEELLIAAIGRERRSAVNEESGHLVSLVQAQAQLHLEQQRFDEAAAALEDVLSKIARFTGVDQTANTRYLLGLTYHRRGQLDRAATMLQQAYSSSQKNPGPQHPLSQEIRIALADVLRDVRRFDEARDMLKSVTLESTPLPPGHPAYAELRRVEGLLALDQGAAEDARERLGQALTIYRERYSAEHWRVRRAESELRRVPGA